MLALILSASSCSPKLSGNFTKTYPPSGFSEDIVVLDTKTSVPSGAERLGSVVLNGSDNYAKMVEKTRQKAWKAGGNLVKVRSYITSGVRSDIHYMQSDVYRYDSTFVHEDSIVSQVAANDVSSSLYPQIGNYVFRPYVGYGRRLNRISPDLDLFQKEHIKRLMNGVMLGADIMCYASNGLGAGFRYQVMHGGSSDAATMTYDDGSSKDGVLDENVNISFLGPLFSVREISMNGKHVLASNVGIGILFYKDRLTFANETAIIDGRTLGLTFDLNYSYFLSKHVALGADISYTSGKLKKYTLTADGQSQSVVPDKDHYEGLAQLGMSGHISIFF